MFEYQKYHRFFAPCAQALEGQAAEELENLGASEVRPAYRGVHFEADPTTLYRINYCARLISHVLAPLITFDCHSDRYLYRTARDVAWESILNVDQTFVISANATDSNVHHSQYAAQKLKDAIADRFREKTGRRPSVDRREADVWIHLHIHRNKARISLDIAGGSMHRRGYRAVAREAPLQETLAAAVIRLSGWDAQTPLVDPMCGSGTLLAEALLSAGRVPASWRRQRERATAACLPDFDSALWDKILIEGRVGQRKLPVDLVSGSDIDPQALDAARMNMSRLPGSPKISLRRQDFRKIDGIENATIITNPPYGKRLGERAAVEDLYREFGDFLKQRCQNSTAWILCGDVKLTKCIGLKIVRRIPLYNGPIECRLVEVPVY